MLGADKYALRERSLLLVSTLLQALQDPNTLSKARLRSLGKDKARLVEEISGGGAMLSVSCPGVARSGSLRRGYDEAFIILEGGVDSRRDTGET